MCYFNRTLHNLVKSLTFHLHVLITIWTPFCLCHMVFSLNCQYKYFLKGINLIIMQLRCIQMLSIHLDFFSKEYIHCIYSQNNMFQFVIIDYQVSCFLPLYICSICDIVFCFLQYISDTQYAYYLLEDIFLLQIRK